MLRFVNRVVTPESHLTASLDHSFSIRFWRCIDESCLESLVLCARARIFAFLRSRASAAGSDPFWDGPRSSRERGPECCRNREKRGGYRCYQDDDGRGGALLGSRRAC